MKQISGEVTTHRKWELDHEFVVEAVLAHIAKVHGVALRLDPKDVVGLREQLAADEYWGEPATFTGKFILEITGKNKC
jgi:hypothetical protein